MSKVKFKAGDKVKITGRITKDAERNQGYVGTITKLIHSSFAAQSSQTGGLGGDYYVEIDKKYCCWPNDITLVASGKVVSPPRFILQHDTEKFELFSTEKELRARIAELAADSTLKRDSIKVYDIKRVRTVTLGVKVTIK